MKKIIINLLLLCLVLPVFSQSIMPTDGDYSNWNWEYQGQENWKRWTVGGGWQEIPPPFLGSTERINEMDRVYSETDYTRAKGWQLIYAHFESTYPYFILYNTHLSLIRAFFFLENTSYTHTLATLSFYKPYQVNFPGILTYGNGNHCMAADKYFTSNTISNNAGDDDMISVVMRNFPQGWDCADFPITFDPNIKNSRYNDKRWVFEFYGCSEFHLKLAGGIASGNTIEEAQWNLSSKRSAKNSSTFDASNNANAVKFNKKFTSFADFIAQIKGTTSTIPPTDSITQNGVKVSNVLFGYKKTIENLANTSGYGKIILNFMNLFTGIFGDKTVASPTALVQAIDVTGTMTINESLGGKILKIPGVNGNPYPTLNWQPYDCVLGIMNLQTTPNIKITTPYDRFEFYDPINMWKKIDKPSNSNYPDFLGKFIQCKFDDNINIAFNDIDGLEFSDLKFALVFKLTGKIPERFDITKKYVKHRLITTSGQEVPINVVNPIYKALDEGTLKIYKYLDNSNDSLREIYVGTPELPMNKLKGISLEIPEKSDIFLRVIATFTSDKYDAPVYFQRDYDLNKAIVNATRNPLNGGEQHTNFPPSDYYTGERQIVLNSTTNTSYTAGKIILKPGFKGQARTVTILGHPIYTGFKATAIDIYPTNGNTVFNNYEFDCDYSNNFNAPRNPNNNFDNENLEEKILIYPNPSSGIFTIFAENSENIKSIKIFDITGRIVYQHFTGTNGEVQVSLNNANSGVYIVQVMLNNGEFYNNRLIIK